MKHKHIFIDYCLGIIGLVLILYYISNAFVSGFLSFSLLFLCLGICFILYASFELYTKENIFRKLPLRIQKSFLILFSICALLFTIVEGVMVYIGQKQTKDSSDIVIVLGAGLIQDKISASLRYRLDATLEYHQLQPHVPIIVTGGQGYGETRTEASAMKEYLIQHGIPEEMIYIEDQSTNTYENFLYARNILENENITVHSATVITNNFHMMRAMYLGQLQGFDTLPYSANTYLPQILNDYVREFFACIKTVILYH